MELSNTLSAATLARTAYQDVLARVALTVDR